MNAILPFSLNTTEILHSKFKQAHVHGSGTHMFSIQNNPLCGHLKKNGFRSGIHEAGAGK